MRCVALFLLAACLWLPAAVTSAADATGEEGQSAPKAGLLEVAPPEGWASEDEVTAGMFAGCRSYARTDGLFALMACNEDIDLSGNTDDGYRRVGDALVRSNEEGVLLLVPRKQEKGAGLFVLLGAPESVWRRQEAAPMLAAFAGAFAVPDALLADPIDPSGYLGLFSFENQAREDELGCPIYVRALPGSTNGKLLAAILPYNAAWLDKSELLAALEAFWGELAPEGEHWAAGPKRHAALAADGRAVCLLMAVTEETTDTTEAIRQAMRELAAFVW